MKKYQQMMMVGSSIVYLYETVNLTNIMFNLTIKYECARFNHKIAGTINHS
jgi:hypothetical protein